ncbi:MAG: hypothetical protein IJ319_05545 [Bacteroidaceae bacterium]|nr:hypothetical protein [Bacteroidaceae bacterium]
MAFSIYSSTSLYYIAVVVGIPNSIDITEKQNGRLASEGRMSNVALKGQLANGRSERLIMSVPVFAFLFRKKESKSIEEE